MTVTTKPAGEPYHRVYTDLDLLIALQSRVSLSDQAVVVTGWGSGLRCFSRHSPRAVQAWTLLEVDWDLRNLSV